MGNIKVIVETNTIFKTKTIGSEDLANFEKTDTIAKDQVFEATDSAPATGQHLFLKLASPILAKDGQTSLQNIYAYDPHVRLEGEDANQVIKLNVPYFSQLNNDTFLFGSGDRQCNTTSNAMLADYLLKGELKKLAQQKGLKEPESAYIPMVAKYGDTVDHPAQTQALKDLGIESYFSRTLSEQDLLMSLKLGIPVVAGVAYKRSGHIILIVGHDPVRKWWLVHDPYGTRHGTSDAYDIGVGGAYDPYSYDTMQAIYWDGGREAGWGRIVTQVKGQPTGLPQGL